MSENSKIEWTDHTFNPWWGCMKVSEGCKHCYAETLDKRWKGGHWGPGSSRKPMSEKYWQQPSKWHLAALKTGIPAKVFCASMADVFEDHPEVYAHRMRLFELIDNTPALIWQLLTKRPENILRFIPLHWIKGLPSNVWIGTSVENQAAADERITHLLGVPAAVRFLSGEPLLGNVDLSEYIILTENNGSTSEVAEKRRWGYDEWGGGFMGPGQCDVYDARSGISWVIAGGESGPHARPMHPDWARSLRDQCKDAEIAFFFKQWGEWSPITYKDSFDAKHKIGHFGHKKELFWIGNHNGSDAAHMERVGKKAAGRLLDGRTHDEFPNQ